MLDASARSIPTAPAVPVQIDAHQTHPRPDRAVERSEVFISPRVIDREAFNDYSQSLRRLIEEADAHGAALRTTMVEAASSQDSMRETANRHQARFEASAKAMAAFELRLADAQRAVAAAQQARQEIQTTADNARQALQQRADHLSAQIGQSATAAEANVRKAEQTSTEIVMNLVASAERKLAQVEAKLIEFKPRSAQTDPQPAPASGGSPNANVSDANAALGPLRQLLTALAAERAAAEARAAQLRVLTEQADRTRAALAEALRSATTQAEAATQRAHAVSEQTQAVAARLARIIDAVGN